MRGRVSQWLRWTVFISLGPYFVVLVVSPFLGREARGWLDRLTGSGQLLLTSIALLGGGLKELGGMAPGLRESHRDRITPPSYVFAVLMAAFCGAIVAKLAGGKPLSAGEQQYARCQ